MDILNEYERTKLVHDSTDPGLPHPKLTLPLKAFGYQYTISLLYGLNESFINSVIVDTGNNLLMLVGCQGIPGAQENQLCVPYNTSSFTPSNLVLVDNDVISSPYRSQFSLLVGFLPPVGFSPPQKELQVQLIGQMNATMLFMHPWNLAGGNLGLSYPDLQSPFFRDSGMTAFQVLLSQVSPNLPVFALDFNCGAKSEIHLGGFSDQYSSVMQWSDSQVVAQPSYHAFHVYGLQVCGVPLFQTYSNHWPALVDTGSVCLSLPAEFYDTLMPWLQNVQCAKVRTRGPRCQVQAGAILPTLVFRISEMGGLLYLPLKNLLLDPNSAGAQKLCIMRTYTILTPQQEQQNGMFDPSFPKIVFGSMALKALYFGADFGTGRIALANKIVPGRSQMVAGCVAPKVCEPSRMLNKYTNQCGEPVCSQYLLWTYDPGTGFCVVQPIYQGAILFILILFVLLETTNHCLSRFLVGRVQQGHAAVDTQALDYRAGDCIDKFIDKGIKLFCRPRGAQHRNSQHVQQTNGRDR